MSSEHEEHSLVTHAKVLPVVKDTVQPSRVGKIKLAFLYVLIGGLAASALLAIIALLLGSFSTEIQRALVTIFIFFSHSLFILAILWADKNNEVGRTLLPTALFTLALANMVTTTLSTWEIIGSDASWRALGVYFLILGAVFIILGILKLRIRHQATKIGTYISAGSAAAFAIALLPWVLQISSTFDPLYFRIVAALAIFASTSFLITLIIRGIAVSHNAKLRNIKIRSQSIPGGLLAIYITVGTITGFVWSAGSTGFLVSAIEASDPGYYTTDSLYY